MQHPWFLEQALPWLLGCLAALVHAAGYIQYNRQTKKDASTPNPASWFIWSIMAGLNLITFAGFTSIPHALQYIVGTFGASTTFYLAIRWGKLDWPSPKEMKVLAVCLATIAVWLIFHSASGANAILMIAFVISIKPTYDGVRNNPHAETALAWWIWTLAFAINLSNNAITLLFGTPDPDTTLIDQIMSVSNPSFLLIAHALIGVLCRQTRKDQFSTPNKQV